MDMTGGGELAGAALGLALGGGLLMILVGLTAAPRRHRRSTTAAIARLVDAAQTPWITPVRLAVGCLVAGLLGAMVALVISELPVIALLAGVLSASAPVMLLRRRARQRERAVRAAWPDAVDALVSGVRSGMALPEALAALAAHGPAALRPAFATFVREYRATGSLSDALGVLESLLADPIADRVVAALLIARDVGGTDLGKLLRGLSALLREDARMRSEIQARQSWTVSAARMAVAAPWITLALLCTRPEAVQAYRTTTGALVLLGAAAASAVAYRLMMRIGRLPAEDRVAA